jgi:hypothetical protein
MRLTNHKSINLAYPSPPGNLATKHPYPTGLNLERNLINLFERIVGLGNWLREADYLYVIYLDYNRVHPKIDREVKVHFLLPTSFLMVRSDFT